MAKGICEEARTAADSFGYVLRRRRNLLLGIREVVHNCEVVTALIADHDAVERMVDVVPAVVADLHEPARLGLAPPAVAQPVAQERVAAILRGLHGPARIGTCDDEARRMKHRERVRPVLRAEI